MKFGSPPKPNGSLEQELHDPAYQGSAFDTCFSEPGPSTGLNSGLDAINTLISELSDVESLTVLSPRSVSEYLRAAEPAVDVDASQDVCRKRYATLSDYSKNLMPVRASSTRVFAGISSASTDLHAVSCVGPRRSGMNWGRRHCSAELYALPKLACAPLQSEIYSSVLVSDELDKCDDESDIEALQAIPSEVPTVSGADSIYGTLVPISPTDEVSRRPSSCSFISPMPSPPSPEDTAHGTTLSGRPLQQDVLIEGPAANSGCLLEPSQSIPAPQPEAVPTSSMEALILRMGAAVGSMSALARPDSGSSLFSAAPELQHRQHVLLQQCVNVLESFLQPEAACGPIDSEMASLQQYTSTMASRMNSRQASSFLRESSSPSPGASPPNHAVYSDIPAHHLLWPELIHCLSSGPAQCVQAHSPDNNLVPLTRAPPR